VLLLQAAIDRYSAKDSDIFVFLLSTRAGGLGITLTAVNFWSSLLVTTVSCLVAQEL